MQLPRALELGDVPAVELEVLGGGQRHAHAKNQAINVGQREDRIEGVKLGPSAADELGTLASQSPEPLGGEVGSVVVEVGD